MATEEASNVEPCAPQQAPPAFEPSVLTEEIIGLGGAVVGGAGGEAEHDGDEQLGSGRWASKRPDLTVPICRDFSRGRCIRPPAECRYAHPPPTVSVDGDLVTVCYDSLRDRCARGYGCRYFHPPPQMRVKLQEAAGLPPSWAPTGYQVDTVRPFDGVDGSLGSLPVGTPAPKPTAKPGVEVCRDFLRGRCSRSAEECKYAHQTPSEGDHVCQDYLRGKCQRDACRYYHVPDHLRNRVKDLPVGSVSNGHGTEGAYGVANFTGAYGYGGNPYEQVPKRMRMDDNYHDDYYGYYYGQGQAAPMYQAPPLPMQPVLPGDTRRWPKDEDRLPICRDFYRRGECARGELCRFVHPEPHIDVVDNFVTICRDSVKGRCLRERCRFFHPTNRNMSKEAFDGTEHANTPSKDVLVESQGLPTVPVPEA